MSRQLVDEQTSPGWCESMLSQVVVAFQVKSDGAHEPASQRLATLLGEALKPLQSVPAQAALVSGGVMVTSNLSKPQRRPGDPLWSDSFRIFS